MQKKQERYYELYPPAGMNVRLEQRDNSGVFESITSDENDEQNKSWVLVTNKDVKADDVIYTESPTVSFLSPEFRKEYCTHCLKRVTAEVKCDNCDVVFCSVTCRETAEKLYHSVLCGVQLGMTGAIIAKLFATSVAEEQMRSGEASEYGTWEHLERLRFLQIELDDDLFEERSQVLNLLDSKLPGIKDFITEERYMTLKGRLMRNLQAVVDQNKEDAEVVEMFRGDGSKRIGAGLYVFSSYIRHSCQPNVKITFKNGNMCSVVALENLKAGDELQAMWTDDPEKTASIWRFKCLCASCIKVSKKVEDKEELEEREGEKEEKEKAEEVKEEERRDELDASFIVMDKDTNITVPKDDISASYILPESN